ncbi:hypothetical protein THAOC_10664, partial [Thalassiosira oceanica]
MPGPLFRKICSYSSAVSKRKVAITRTYSAYLLMLDWGPKIQSKMLEMATRSGFKLKEITGEIPLSSLDDDWSEG